MLESFENSMHLCTSNMENEKDQQIKAEWKNILSNLQSQYKKWAS